MTTPLNKISVLDKGYVALVSASCDGKVLKGLEDSYFRGAVNRELWHLANMTLLVRCPLFKQINFSSKCNLRVLQLPHSDDIEAYVPDVSEIHTGNASDDKEMAEYISATTEALLIAPKGLQQDNCDKFVSQVNTPISVYNEVMVHGSLNEWLKYVKQRNLPAQLEAYRVAIEGIMAAEWKELDTYKKGM